MKKLFNIKADGSLTISIDDQLFDNFRKKAHTWYTSKKLSYIAPWILVIIDILGFLQITNLTFKTSPQNQIIVVSAFAIAFEIAPLYIGYALCLKNYKLGRPIHNWILLFSSVACILGVIANIIFRSLTMNIAYLYATGSKTSELALPMTILMSILPVITSLVNLVIGCLSFDPLLFDIMHLSKKLKLLKVRKRQLEGCLEELNNDHTLEISLNEEEEKYCNSVKIEIAALRTRLYNYISAQSSSIYRR